MKHLGFSKERGRENYPVISPNLVVQLQYWLATKGKNLPKNSKLRQDVERMIAELLINK